MRTTNLLASCLASSALAASFAALPAQAQEDQTDAEEARLGTVTITAQRRGEEDLQTVPVAVTALTTQDLEEQQIADVLDLQYAVPNISIATGTGTANSARIFLRGVGEDESRGAVDPAVGIYVDGIYIGRQVGSLFDVVDLAQIEVLRGPQGTLYGRNTNGGAIRLTSVRPQDELGGELRTTIGNEGRFDLRGTANIPVGETAGFRVTALHRERDGFWDLNPNGPFEEFGREVGRLHTFGARAGFEVDFNPDWSLYLAYDYTLDRSDPVPDSAAPPNDVDNDLFTIEPLEGVTCSPLTPATFQPLGCFTNYNNRIEAQGFTANLEGNFGPYTLTSLTGYRELEDELSTRIGFPYFQETDQDQTSQELTLASDYAGPFNFVAGIFYFEEDVLLETTFVFPAVNDVSTESISVFGQGTYDLTEKATLTAGLRYTEEDKDFRGEALAFGLGREESATFDNTSFTIGVDYQFTEDVMGYGKFATGFKSGGWSPDCFSGTACFLPVEEETLDSFELGLRSDLFTDTLRFNATYFFNTYENLQIGATVPGLGFTRFNVAETEIQGLEIEAVLRATEALEFIATLGILDAEYTELNGDQARGLTNNGASCPGVDPTDDQAIINCAFDLELKNAPEYKGALSAVYTFDALAGEFKLRGDILFEDDSWSLVANGPPHALTDPGTLFNARLSYQPDEGNYTVAIWGQNLSDEEYWRAASANSFTAYGAPPLTFGIDLGITF